MSNTRRQELKGLPVTTVTGSAPCFSQHALASDGMGGLPGNDTLGRVSKEREHEIQLDVHGGHIAGGRILRTRHD
jgi:hypothetical protein